MKRRIAVLLFVIASVPALAQPAKTVGQVNHCTDALPKDGNGAVYDRLRTSSYTDLHYLLDEYIYQMNFSSMDQALSAGLNVDAIVYKVPLKIGGKFDETKKQEWRTEYEMRRKTQFAQTTLSTLEIDKLNPSVISVIASACMDFGLFSTYRPTDECHFTFRAGYRSDKAKGERITPARLTVVGGTCTPWPKVLLSPGGNEVTCTRSGKGATQVTLTTNEVGDASQTFPPIDPPALPPEPQMVEKQSETITQDIAVNGWQATHIGGNVECPDCKDLFAQNFAPDLGPYPGNKGASISSVALVSRSGTCSHWIVCPDGGGCGRPEFSSTSDQNVSCLGQPSCRMYHVTNGSTACTETVHVTFTYKSDVCENCNGKSFSDAVAAWNKTKEEAGSHACPALTDGGPQILMKQ